MGDGDGVFPDEPGGEPDEGGGVRSIGDRAGAGEHEQPEEELFPLGSLEGDGKSLKTLLRGGLPVEVTTSILSAEVPIRGGGLLDPERAGKVLVSYEVAKVETVLIREEGKIVKAKIRQVLRPTYVEAGAAALADAA